VYLIGNSKKEVNNAVFTAYKALRSLESVILLLKTPKIARLGPDGKVSHQNDSITASFA
jgi:hypothetical protein